MLRLRIGFALLALLLLCGRAHAFFMDGCTNGRSPSVATVVPSGPTANANVGDTLVLIVTSDVAAAPNITLTGGTGTWNASLASTAFHGGAAKIAVWTHPNYNPGVDTMPTIGDGGTASTYTWINCSYFGVDPTTQTDATPTTTTTASGTTGGGCGTQVINFPSVTPANANDELLLITGIHGASTPTFSSPSTLTTCSKTSDQTFVNSKTSGVSEINVEQINQGPCAATASSTATICSSSAGDNIGVALPLRSAPFSPVQPPLIQPLAKRMAGVYDFWNFKQSRNTWPTQDSASWIDGYTVDQSWQSIEPNACDEYNFDFADNLILNARVLGKQIMFGIGGWDRTLCGGTGQPSCTGFTDGSNLPAWAAPPSAGTTCNGSHTWVSGTDYITSPYTGSNSPQTTPTVEMDPQSTAYQTELDRAINDYGTRWGSISNVVAVATGAMTQSDCCTSMSMDNGPDGSSVVCNGTAAQCNSISQDADWPGTSHSVALNHIILPTASSNNAACSSTPCVFKATTGGTTSASTQPTWSSCTTTCTDGSVVWTNQGAFSVTLADKTNWLAVPPSGGGSYAAVNSSSCGGGLANQSWVQCDAEAGAKHFEATVHSAFPNAVVYIARNNKTSPEGIVSGSPDPFTTDMNTYNATTYPGASSNLDYSIGCHTGSCPLTTAGMISPNLPLALQPFTSPGWQASAVEHNISGVICNSGTGGYFSLSAGNCLIPSLYALANVAQYPYYEAYLGDIQDTNSQPWLIWLHNLARGIGRPPGVMAGSSSVAAQFSSQLGNSLAQPGTFETGHP